MRARSIRGARRSAVIGILSAATVVLGALVLAGSVKAKLESEASDEVRVLNAQSGALVKAVAVGHVPRGIALSADGKKLYVTNSWDDTASEIDTSSLKVVRTLTTGFEPNGLAVDTENKTLYVANRLSNDVSVIDLASGQERKRLAAGRGASYLTLSPTGDGFIARTFIPRLALTAPRPNRKSRLSTPSGRSWWIASCCTTLPAFSIRPSPRTEG